MILYNLPINVCALMTNILLNPVCPCLLFPDSARSPLFPPFLKNHLFGEKKGDCR